MCVCVCGGGGGGGVAGTLKLEEITGALLSFNQRKKASDGNSQSEGFVSGAWEK